MGDKREWWRGRSIVNATTYPCPAQLKKKEKKKSLFRVFSLINLLTLINY
jgi:hypothetical protein